MPSGTHQRRINNLANLETNVKRGGAAWLPYILPALLVYTCFMALPLFNSLVLSLFSGQGFRLDEFVGLDNFARLFGSDTMSERYWGAFFHTWYFFFIHMFVQNSLGLLFAVLLASGLRGANTYRTVIFIPATVAILVTGYLWRLILNPQWGALNIVLNSMGLEQLALSWLGDKRLALTVISLVSSWQWVGIPTMMFLAGLQSISDDLFEAADIEGASGWQKFVRIKLPLLRPIIGIVSVMTFVNNFNAFDVVLCHGDSKWGTALFHRHIGYPLL